MTETGSRDAKTVIVRGLEITPDDDPVQGLGVGTETGVGTAEIEETDIIIRDEAHLVLAHEIVPVDTTIEEIGVDAAEKIIADALAPAQENVIATNNIKIMKREEN